LQARLHDYNYTFPFSIIERVDCPWHTVYGFINNRCQSIRQDITYQQLEGPEVVHIYKLATRFYIYAQYRLAGEIIERFDPKRNADQLQQCLSKLLRLFNQNLCHSSNGKRESSAALASEWAEAESYYLLTNLAGTSEAAMHALNLPVNIRTELAVRAALKMTQLTNENNFVRIFRLFPGLPPLGKCAVYPYVQTLRRQGLQTLCNAYCVGPKPSPFPLRLVAQWFMFDGAQEAAEYCKYLGLRVDDKNVLLQKSNLQLSSLQGLNEHPITIPEASIHKCGQLISMPT
jgi:hypothetical protein